MNIQDMIDQCKLPPSGDKAQALFLFKEMLANIEKAKAVSHLSMTIASDNGDDVPGVITIRLRLSTTEVE